jgi:hypothetical protein
MEIIKYFFLSLCFSSIVAHANQLSISGKPQDEAYCAILGTAILRNNDSKCRKTEIRKIAEWYEFKVGIYFPTTGRNYTSNECANIFIPGKNSDPNLDAMKVAYLSNQIELAKRNNFQILFSTLGLNDGCDIEFKTRQKSAFCSAEWLSEWLPVKFLKVEVLGAPSEGERGNPHLRRGIEWKKYCS